MNLDMLWVRPHRRTACFRACTACAALHISRQAAELHTDHLIMRVPSPWGDAAHAIAPTLANQSLRGSRACAARAVSGLTLGLLSLDRLDLEVMLRTGTPKEQKLAAKLTPIIRYPHWVLATLVRAEAGGPLAAAGAPSVLHCRPTAIFGKPIVIRTALQRVQQRQSIRAQPPCNAVCRPAPVHLFQHSPSLPHASTWHTAPAPANAPPPPRARSFSTLYHRLPCPCAWTA